MRYFKFLSIIIIILCFVSLISASEDISSSGDISIKPELSETNCVGFKWGASCKLDVLYDSNKSSFIAFSIVNDYELAYNFPEAKNITLVKISWKSGPNHAAPRDYYLEYLDSSNNWIKLNGFDYSQYQDFDKEYDFDLSGIIAKGIRLIKPSLPDAGDAVGLSEFRILGNDVDSSNKTIIYGTVFENKLDNFIVGAAIEIDCSGARYNVKSDSEGKYNLIIDSRACPLTSNVQVTSLVNGKTFSASGNINQCSGNNYCTSNGASYYSNINLNLSSSSAPESSSSSSRSRRNTNSYSAYNNSSSNVDNQLEYTLNKSDSIKLSGNTNSAENKISSWAILEIAFIVVVVVLLFSFRKKLFSSNY